MTPEYGDDVNLLTLDVLTGALNSVSDAIIILDVEGKVLFANRSAEELLGLKAGFDQSITELLVLVDRHSGIEQQPTLAQLTAPSFASEVQKNCHLLVASGETVPFSLSLDVIYEKQDGNHPIYYIVKIVDNSITQRLTDTANYHRRYDLVTGLVNRYEFQEQLKRAVQDSITANSHHCLCVISLEPLELINKSAGHLAGDELLKLIAQEFQSAIRPNDVLARFSTSEFALLLWRVDQTVAQQVARKLIKKLKNLTFDWQGREYLLACHVGIAEINSSIESWPEIIRMAELACNEAKKSGSNHYCCYNNIEEAAEAQEFEIEWVSNIVSAVRHDKFLLYQQPIITLSSSAGGNHAEVLLRMRDASGGVINPGACLLAAEKYDMINMIDRWVVHKVFYWLAENREVHLEHLNINLSGISVTRDDFLHYIHELADSLLVPTEKICFEITETAAVENIAKAKHFIASVKELGCRVALDDFGSGMCSFSYLKNMPVDYVKIDGEFVREIHQDPVSRSMVEAINSVCQKMGIKTIAEYVESQEVMEVLKAIGVNYAQGFAIAEPSPISKLLDLQYNKRHYNASLS